MEGLTILRTALKANGFFSLTMAAVTLILGSTVIAINEMANGQPTALSLQLFFFAAVVLLAAYRKKVPTILVWIIIVLDVLYVLLGLYTLSLVASEISIGGTLLIIGTNLLVAVFATFQTIGLIRYKKSVRLASQ
ncbi:hypothetical protein [Flagellimonas sp. 2504JD4-2]